MLLLSGSANPQLAGSLARALDIIPGQCRIENFPDGETGVVIAGDLVGRDVYLLQPTGPPVADNIMELMLLGDACRRNGAAQITALIPYLGYARQDRKDREGSPVGARLVADLLAQRFDRIVAVDLHSRAIEGFFSIPLVHLSATEVLAQALKPSVSAGTDILVAPDLGAVKLARNFADLLQLPMAFVHKERTGGAEVTVKEVIGEVKNRRPIIVDDMISTGGTIVSAVEALLEAGARQPLAVAATHGLLVGDAVKRLGLLNIEKLLVTNSLNLEAVDTPVSLEVVDISDIMANCIRHLVLKG